MYYHKKCQQWFNSYIVDGSQGQPGEMLVDQSLRKTYISLADSLCTKTPASDQCRSHSSDSVPIPSALQ